MFLILCLQLPDSIKEFYHKCYGAYPTADMLTHLKRELAHGCLRLILGGSVADAQNNGRVARCADEVLRRWFFRLIFHSADYIEKLVRNHLILYMLTFSNKPGG